MINDHLIYHKALFTLRFKCHVFADDFVEMFWIRHDLSFETDIYWLTHFQVTLVLQLASIHCVCQAILFQKLYFWLEFGLLILLIM